MPHASHDALTVRPDEGGFVALADASARRPAWAFAMTDCPALPRRTPRCRTIAAGGFGHMNDVWSLPPFLVAEPPAVLS